MRVFTVIGNKTVMNCVQRWRVHVMRGSHRDPSKHIWYVRRCNTGRSPGKFYLLAYKKRLMKGGSALVMSGAAANVERKDVKNCTSPKDMPITP